MKHTKNILKSLLITVMALSLLAVSCKKDEGGSKPTDPTPITITAAMMTAELQKIKVDQVIDFTGKTPAGGSVDINALTDSYGKIKLVFEQLAMPGVTLTTTIPAKPSNSEVLSVVIKIVANYGFVLDTAMKDNAVYQYDEAKKEASLTIKVTPSGAWQN